MYLNYVLLGMLLSTQVLANPSRIVLREANNAVSLKLSSRVTETSPDTCTGTEDSTIGCSSSTYVKYLTEASINLTVVDDPAFSVKGEELAVDFLGEELSVKSKTASQTVFLVEKAVTKKIVGRTHFITFDVRLLPRNVATLSAAIDFANFQVKNGLMSFQTGVSGEEARTRFSARKGSWLGYYETQWEGGDITDRLNVEPFAGGLRHTLDVREAGTQLRGRMEFVLLRDAGTTDTRNLLKAQAIRIKYR
jgi:hypothetical protein